jgi:hypothetical protein
MPLPETRNLEGFWKRQFAPEMTGPQILFDVVAGILLPIVCMVLDPFIFRVGLGGGAMFGSYAIAARLMIGLSILGLSIWLAFRRPAAIMAGTLGAGAAFALGLGAVLVPYSLYGLMIVIGVAGFSPFLTGFVFLRNAVRAHAQARERHGRNVTGLVTAVAFVLAVGLPLTLQKAAQREVAVAIRSVLAADEPATAHALARLRSLGWLTETDAIVWAYQREGDRERQGRLSKFYRSLTGRPIEERLEKLWD